MRSYFKSHGLDLRLVVVSGFVDLVGELTVCC